MAPKKIETGPAHRSDSYQVVNPLCHGLCMSSYFLTNTRSSCQALRYIETRSLLGNRVLKQTLGNGEGKIALPGDLAPG